MVRAQVLPFQGFERLDDVLCVPPKEIHLDGNEGRTRQRETTITFAHLRADKSEGQGVGNGGDIPDLPPGEEQVTTLISGGSALPPGGQCSGRTVTRV